MSQQSIQKVLSCKQGRNRNPSIPGLHRTEYSYSCGLFKRRLRILPRYKADEAYLVGEGKKPIDAYLDIEGIIEIAKTKPSRCNSSRIRFLIGKYSVC